MRIVGKYSFNYGSEYISQHYANLFNEILSIIQSVDAMEFKTKVSKEQTMVGKYCFRQPD